MKLPSNNFKTSPPFLYLKLRKKNQKLAQANSITVISGRMPTRPG